MSNDKRFRRKGRKSKALKMSWRTTYIESERMTSTIIDFRLWGGNLNAKEKLQKLWTRALDFRVGQRSQPQLRCVLKKIIYGSRRASGNVRSNSSGFMTRATDLTVYLFGNISCDEGELKTQKNKAFSPVPFLVCCCCVRSVVCYQKITNENLIFSLICRGILFFCAVFFFAWCRWFCRW